MNTDLFMKRLHLENEENWWEWTNLIPSISFPSDWQIKVVPPFGGTMARFFVNKEGAGTSVFLDVFSRLGANPEPYWEVYPVEGDIERVPMEDTDKLLKVIEQSLNEQRNLN